MSDFVTRLKDCCSFQEGYVNPSQKIPEYFGGKIKWLRASDLTGYFVYDTEETLSDKGYKSAGKSALLFEKDTIAISKSGTVGELGILKDRMCGNRAIINIAVDIKKADLFYVFNLLRYKRREIVAKASGSIQKNLYISALETIALSHSGILSQKKIAAVLAGLDAKIELNRRINAELERLAKTIYDYWFVQFDFPDAHGRPYKSSGGKMTYNPTLKRQIPEGWEVGSLLDIAIYTNGLACQRFRPTSYDKLRVIKIKEMHEGFSSDTEYVRTNIPEAVKVYDGDILFSWSASLEVQVWTGGNGALNQHIFKVTPTRYPKSFYYFQLVDYLRHFQMMAEKRKTTMGHITQEHLMQSRITMPPAALTERLDEIVKPMFDKFILYETESRQLAALRDWLLPMLMNGQVTVKKIGQCL